MPPEIQQKYWLSHCVIIPHQNSSETLYTREPENSFKVILFRGLVLFLKPASKTPVQNDIGVMFWHNTYRFHRSLACCLAISRVHVNVFAPQTRRTVVGVPRPFYIKTASLADKVFLCALEFLCLHLGGRNWTRFKKPGQFLTAPQELRLNCPSKTSSCLWPSDLSVGNVGIEPTTSSMWTKRSATELIAHAFIQT